MDTQHTLIVERAAAFRRAARTALQRTGALIDRFPNRLAGTDSCRKTAEALREALDAKGLKTCLEAFETHPATFNYFYRIDAVLYLVGLALLFLRQPLLAGLVLLFMITGAGLEFGWYIELYDRFFPHKTYHNLTAVLEPRGTAKRQLIFSAHHDAAQELRFLKRHQKLYGLKILVPDSVRMTANVFAWLWVAWQAFAGHAPAFTPYVLAFLVIGIYPVFTKFFAFGPLAVPGAGDNLIASAMLVELAGMLADPANPGCSTLDSTQLLFVSFDAEESGLRGSRAWVKAHRADLQSLPARAVNIDSIYNARDLQFMVSDLNGHIALDRPLAERCIAIAGEAGYTARPLAMRFGGGATDATELARAGIPATTMIAMPASIIRDGLVYHTMQDTVDAIEPAAVEACLEVAYRLGKEAG